jgi:hypothetical protein
MWFVSRRRYAADTAALKAEADRLRTRAEKAEGIAATEVGARRVIGKQNDQLETDVTRLAGQVAGLKRQLAIADEAAGIDHARAQDVGNRLVTVRDAAARARKRHATTVGEA